MDAASLLLGLLIGALLATAVTLGAVSLRSRGGPGNAIGAADSPASISEPQVATGISRSELWLSPGSGPE